MSAPAGRPVPMADVDSRPFWEGCARRVLLAQRCERCDAWRWPPMAFCPSCHTRGGAWIALPGTGTVATFAVAHRAFHPGFADEIPLVIALISLDGTDGGVLLRSNVIGCDPGDVAIGMRVTVTFRDVAADIALPLFTSSSGS